MMAGAGLSFDGNRCSRIFPTNLVKNIILFVLISQSPLRVSSQLLFENDVCNGGAGTCKKLDNCPSAVEGLKQGKRPMMCGFQGSRPIVCCPREVVAIQRPRPVDQSTPQVNLPAGNSPGSKAKRYCREYAKTVKKVEETLGSLPGLPQEFTEVDYCGQIEEPLIVGGTNAKPREFPHMALIGYGSEPSIKFLCGGTLISEKFILSAAHCSDPGARWGPASWAKVGELDLDSTWEEAKPVTVKISRRINHPQYRKDRHYNDIALYQLERPVQFNEFVRPICLHTGDPINEKTAIATGWGHTEFAGRGSKDLKKVRVKIIDIATCNRTYRNSIGSSLPNGILADSQICAGEDGKDSCQGDSGGPLQIPLKDPYCMYNQIGITSFGKSCGSNPGVYTRISHYISWIESIVWP